MTIESPDRIHIGHEVVAGCEGAHKLDLQIATRLADANAIFLRKALEQLNALLEHRVPAIALGVVQRLFLRYRPLSVESHGRIFTAEVSTQSLFEGSAEEHGSAGVSLLPAVQIAMPVPARAVQVMADLSVRVGHEATLARGNWSSIPAESSSHRLRGAKPSRLSREVPLTTEWVIFTTPESPTRFLSSISSRPSSSVS